MNHINLLVSNCFVLDYELPDIKNNSAREGSCISDHRYTTFIEWYEGYLHSSIRVCIHAMRQFDNELH